MIAEFIAELFFEGMLEIMANKAVSKWVRYPLTVLVVCFFGIIIIGLFLLGCKVAATQLLIALFLWAFSAVALVWVVSLFKKKRRSKL